MADISSNDSGDERPVPTSSSATHAACTVDWLKSTLSNQMGGMELYLGDGITALTDSALLTFRKTFRSCFENAPGSSGRSLVPGILCLAYRHGELRLGVEDSEMFTEDLVESLAKSLKTILGNPNDDRALPASITLGNCRDESGPKIAVQEMKDSHKVFTDEYISKLRKEYEEATASDMLTAGFEVSLELLGDSE